MAQEKCPLCLKIKNFDVEEVSYLKYQNTERLVCIECRKEIEGHLRPTWQIVGNRIFPKVFGRF
ncbi:MAG: hypothetical protein HQM10_01390 [Candidatus Riflebacteria bacterium]|nr:hypothetical protein [Candidatus Riflebacteria bacterium]